MFKWRGPSRKKILYYSIIASTITIFFYNVTPSKPSDFIKRDEILSSLHAETARNFTSSAREYCDYNELVVDESVLPMSLTESVLDQGRTIREGGEYAPRECKPRYSVAIIIPYKDEVEQLRALLIYLHHFLQKQNLHYRLYVIEQIDASYYPSQLINIGAVAAINDGYPCLILHDENLLPLRPANMYACTRLPRNMFYDVYRFRLFMPYALSSSAVAILASQFKTINGLSSRHFDKGWDSDHNDFQARLNTHGLKLCRFDPDISQYYMTKDNNMMWEHKPMRVNQEDSAQAEISSDGLNNLRYTKLATVLHPLFTHIMIDLEYQKNTAKH